MRIIFWAAVLAALGAASSAWGFGAGGTAPGGPLSGSIRPACNGYDMSGRPAGGGCDGLSVDQRRARAQSVERGR